MVLAERNSWTKKRGKNALQIIIYIYLDKLLNLITSPRPPANWWPFSWTLAFTNENILKYPSLSPLEFVYNVKWFDFELIWKSNWCKVFKFCHLHLIYNPILWILNNIYTFKMYNHFFLLLHIYVLLCSLFLSFNQVQVHKFTGTRIFSKVYQRVLHHFCKVRVGD